MLMFKPSPLREEATLCRSGICFDKQWCSRSQEPEGPAALPVCFQSIASPRHSVARMLAVLIMKAISTASPSYSDCPPVKIRHPIEK